MRRATLLLITLAVLSGASAEAQFQGCVAPCEQYTMRGDGRYAGVGDWELRVARGGTVRVLRDGEAPATGAVRSGDVVSATTTGPSSRLVVSQAAPNSDLVGDCDRGGYASGGAPATRSPDDPLFAEQWALHSLHVPEAWALGGRGGSAVVAVVDTGVDLRHPDLAGRLRAGIDLWETRSGALPDCPGPQDEQFHGTMVAGTIAATADNGIGTAGVAPAAKLLPVRVRDDVSSLDFSRVALGIRWAADNGADVISLTGGVALPVRPSPLLQEEVAEAAAYAWQRGVVTVATAGNTGLPWCQYPAADPHVVCASANAHDGSLASYSQRPVRLDGGLAVRAPGGTRGGACSRDDVLAPTLPGSILDTCGRRGYATDSGTTYATAHTAGVAALLAGRGLDRDGIVACLRASAAGGGQLDGAGTIDALRAAECAVSRKRSSAR